MHLAMLIDAERLQHERSLLNRLCLGLIGESVQITWIVPPTDEGTPDGEGNPGVAGVSGVPQMSPARQIEIAMRVPRWFRSTRINSLASSLKKNPPDVLYAIGGATWNLALDLSRRLECPLALDIWKPSLLRALPRGRRARCVACYVVAGRALAEDLRRQVEEELISIIPPGVAPATPSRQPLANLEDVLALAVLGSGSNLPAYEDLLTGLSRLVRELPQTRIFLELCGPRSHEIWRRAQRLDLLAHISTFSDASHLRPLLTRCDAILLPERSGDIRSIILEGMMVGLPILTARDPYLDFLEDGVTALLIDDPTPEKWTKLLRRMSNDTAAVRLIGENAALRASEFHRSTRQIRLLHETLERIVIGETYSFKDTQTRDE